MKNNLVFLLMFALLVQLHAAPVFKGNVRTKYNFNPQWKMHVGDDPGTAAAFSDPRFNDAGWKQVDLPRAFNEDEAYRVAIDEHTDTIIWYRKQFRLPREARGQKIFLELEGIRFGGEFWVNGRR